MKKYLSFLNIKKLIMEKLFGVDFTENSTNQEEIQKISEEELKPYIYDYSYNIESAHYLKEKYEMEGRPMDDIAYRNIINEKINLNKFTFDGKEDVLYNVWNDAKLINEILYPLKNMNISYTLDLTGGCVRDFLLDRHKEIKDLDFMLSIGYQEMFKLKIEDYFTKEELEAVNWSEVEQEDQSSDVVIISDEKMKVKLLSLCMNRFDKNYILFDKTQKRTSIETQVGGYILQKHDRLIAVTKLENEKFNYPLDILLTDFIKPQFIKDFDFDICKASICFVNDSVNKDFPINHKQLINRCIGEADFWADVIHQKITYNVDDRTPREIDRSFNDHYKRIKTKFPGYDLNIVGSDIASVNYIKSIILANQLNENLNTKKEPKQRKNKI